MDEKFEFKKEEVFAILRQASNCLKKDSLTTSAEQNFLYSIIRKYLDWFNTAADSSDWENKTWDFATVWGSLENSVEKFISWIETNVSDWTQDASDLLRDLLNTILDSVNSSVNDIKTAMALIKQKLTEVSAGVSALMAGLKSAVDLTLTGQAAFNLAECSRGENCIK